MLAISQQQIDAFSRSIRARFEAKLIAEIKAQFAEQTALMPDESLRSRVHDTVDRAMSFGIEAEEDVAAYVRMTFELGEKFDADPRYPWAGRILHDPERDGTEKVRALEDELAELKGPENED